MFNVQVLKSMNDEKYDLKGCYYSATLKNCKVIFNQFCSRKSGQAKILVLRKPESRQNH